MALTGDTIHNRDVRFWQRCESIVQFEPDGAQPRRRSRRYENLLLFEELDSLATSRLVLSGLYDRCGTLALNLQIDVLGTYLLRLPPHKSLGPCLSPQRPRKDRIDSTPVNAGIQRHLSQASKDRVTTYLYFWAQHIYHRCVQRVELLFSIENISPESGIGLEYNGCLRCR